MGYLKGGRETGQNLVFNVQNTPGTASELTVLGTIPILSIDERHDYIQCLSIIVGEGSQFDYTVNTVRVMALANGQINNVALTIREDTIAQEPNETFTLILIPSVAPIPREGSFFLNTTQVMIVDSDSKAGATEQNHL